MGENSSCCSNPSFCSLSPARVTRPRHLRHSVQVIASIVKHYIEGLVWVMRYYYDGVASWNW